MNPSEWHRIGTICRIRRTQARLGLIEMQEILGVESISFIIRMERGEFAPDLLWDFWTARDQMENQFSRTRLSA